MGDVKDGRSAMGIDGSFVRELADLLAETNLTEIEVEDGDRRIRVVRALPLAAPAANYVLAPPAQAGAPAAPVVAAPAAAEQPAAAAADGNAVKSPMVGTAYLSAEPGAKPFIAVGATVKAGETLLIIEAMKVMNAIAAPSAGTIKAILIENAHPVEYDQPLVVIG